MKRLTFLISALFVSGLAFCSQNAVSQAPSGGGIIRADIPHGKIDTITYKSKTVGTGKTLYTPPCTSHEWLTWRRSLHQFATIIFK